MTRSDQYNSMIQKHITLKKGWYRDAFLPVRLTRIDDGSSVIAEPGKWGGYYYVDQKSGNRVRINAENDRLFSRDALMYYSTFKNGKMSVGDVIAFRLSHIRPADYAWFIAITLSATGLSLLIPWLTKILTGDVVYKGSMSLLVSVALCMLISALISRFISIVKSIATSRIGMGSRIAVETAAMHRVMSLPLDLIQRFGTGELRQRMQSIIGMSDIFIDNVMVGSVSAIFSLLFMIQIRMYGQSLLVPALLILSATLILSVTSTAAQISLEKKIMEAGAKRSSTELETISGVIKIKHTGSENRAINRWEKLYDREAAYRYRPPIFLRISPALSTAVKLIGVVVIYYFATMSDISASDYLAFMAAYSGLSSAFISINDIALSAAKIYPSYDLARPIMDAENISDDEGEDIGEVSGDIELSHVSFRYNDDGPLVIDDLSLHISPGECVGISGPTGSGKTTLVRLILGLVTPESGQVKYDGHDIQNVNRFSLRKQMGTVMQDGRLFASDIYSNVTIAHPYLSEDEVWEALRIACLDDDIRALPLGLYSQIFENRNGISGGQKQRLMIAQAIAHKPRIMILDEATSALDNELEHRILSAIKATGCTVIVVAHRPSALKWCDRVVNIGEIRS